MQTTRRLNDKVVALRAFSGLKKANDFTFTPGGRSSNSGITATVFGGYGFLGSYVVNQLGSYVESAITGSLDS
jgi:NADH dehydrogenase (ubiquinone) 1 alpha subcomplex subunit 9